MHVAAIGTHGDGLARGTKDGECQSPRHLALYDLLAMVLHELRAPLSSLTVTVELLLGNYDQLGAIETLSLLQRAQRSTAWLQALVENLSVEAQLEVSELQLRWGVVDLSESLEMARVIVQPSLDRERQKLVVDKPNGVRAVGDPRRVEQVLVNLLINASRYGGPDTTIRVGVVDEDQRLRIFVRDEGPGIPADEQSRIFERYERGSAAQSGSGGLGLGLHIVKTLVELHEGAVGVASEVGKGATFWFTLPSWAADEPE